MSDLTLRRGESVELSIEGIALLLKQMFQATPAYLLWSAFQR